MCWSGGEVSVNKSPVEVEVGGGRSIHITLLGGERNMEEYLLPPAGAARRCLAV